MEAKEQHITIEKTARFHTWGNHENPEIVWFVLHGYGQLSQFFIRKFNSLDPNKNLVVAPEGLHRFYLSGNHGRVGASWMTKEDRLTDIEDYVAYLDLLYLKIRKDVPSAKICILGFSQGSATACRWIFQGHAKADYLVLWASMFPPDINFETHNSLNQSMKTFVVYGSNDQYMSMDDFRTHFEDIESKGVSLIKIPFEGDHNIYEEPLKLLTRNMVH